MLVILTQDQLLSPQAICHNCLLADQQGLPRWRQDTLCCGQQVSGQAANSASEQRQFLCRMGFRVADVAD